MFNQKSPYNVYKMLHTFLLKACHIHQDQLIQTKYFTVAYLFPPLRWVIRL